MDNIWSENKYINLCINILLFLTGINFLHYGQLILPVICFLLFVDRKMKFYVNSPLTFVVLCLFAVSFYYFSVKDFYCVMGFTLPMAYYIGCNIHEVNEEKIRKVIYLLAISMGLHVILNAIIEAILHGHHGFFFSSTHYDFWTREKISNTATAINIDILLGCVYYLIFHEKNKVLKIIDLVTFVLAMFYLMVIGRRTPVMMIFIVFVVSFVYETIYLKNTSARLRTAFIRIFVSVIVFVALIVTIYTLNIFGAKDVLNGYRIIGKFSKGFINDQRFELYFGSFKLMPKYLWGGQHISKILGEQVHDFWIDIYDYAGIVTCAIMIVYSIICLINSVKLLKNNYCSNKFRVLYLGVFVSITLQLFFEPVMTGSSIFVIVAIVIIALAETLVPYEK